MLRGVFLGKFRPGGFCRVAPFSIRDYAELFCYINKKLLCTTKPTKFDYINETLLALLVLVNSNRREQKCGEEFIDSLLIEYKYSIILDSFEDNL